MIDTDKSAYRKRSRLSLIEYSVLAEVCRPSGRSTAKGATDHAQMSKKSSFASGCRQRISLHFDSPRGTQSLCEPSRESFLLHPSTDSPNDRLIIRLWIATGTGLADQLAEPGWSLRGARFCSEARVTRSAPA